MIVILKFVAAIPVFVTLCTLADDMPHWTVAWCFGFTAYLLADMAVRGWRNDK